MILQKTDLPHDEFWRIHKQTAFFKNANGKPNDINPVSKKSIQILLMNYLLNTKQNLKTTL
jgi:hypothetical protein